MIDRELMDAISQLLDVKLTNELGPIKYGDQIDQG